jgi:hypothetical protein
MGNWKGVISPDTNEPSQYGRIFSTACPRTWSQTNIGGKELRGAFRTHRSYILAYYEIHKQQAEENGLAVDQVVDADTVRQHCSNVDYKTIEEKMKNYKNHLCVMEVMGKTVGELAG